jgi:hypothetical protein
MYYFCVGSGGANPLMHHVLPLLVPLQVAAAAIWTIKDLLLHLLVCYVHKNVYFSQE